MTCSACGLPLLLQSCFSYCAFLAAVQFTAATMLGIWEAAGEVLVRAACHSLLCCSLAPKRRVVCSRSGVDELQMLVTAVFTVATWLS